MKSPAQGRRSINTKYSRLSFIPGSSHPNSLPGHQEASAKGFSEGNGKAPGSVSGVGLTAPGSREDGVGHSACHRTTEAPH